MIKAARFFSIGITGAIITLALIDSPHPFIPVAAALSALLWILFGHRLKLIHNLALPLFTGALLSRFLFGGSLISQSLLFTLLLSAWEIDALYIDSGDAVEKKKQLKLLAPLLIIEAAGLILIGLVYVLTEKKGLRIGFWPLMAIVLSLIIILRKLYSLKDE